MRAQQLFARLRFTPCLRGQFIWAILMTDKIRCNFRSRLIMHFESSVEFCLAQQRYRSRPRISSSAFRFHTLSVSTRYVLGLRAIRSSSEQITFQKSPFRIDSNKFKSTFGLISLNLKSCLNLISLNLKFSRGTLTNSTTEV